MTARDEISLKSQDIKWPGACSVVLVFANTTMLDMSTGFLLAILVATVIIALVAFEGGLWIGRWRSQRPDPEAQLPVRTLVASILGLLAFILGFTFDLASSHYDSRSQSILDEAIALRMAYHRADFLPDAERTNIRRLLRQYVDLRLEVGRSGNLDEVLGSLRHLQDDIWAQAVEAGKKETGPSLAPLVQSLTEVVDVHGERALAGIQSRIPAVVWCALYGMMVLSVASAGYLSGLAGTRRSLAAVAYAMAFAAVIVMIAAADIPQSRQFLRNHQALSDLRTEVMGHVDP